LLVTSKNTAKTVFDRKNKLGYFFLKVSLILKTFYTFNFNPLSSFNFYQKFHQHLRALWSQINDYISAVDELNMCRMRFRLRYENEPLVKNKPKKASGSGPNLGSNLQNKVEHIYIIEPHDVEPQCLRLTLERSEGERSLRRRKGQLQYLLNLERDDIASAGGENPEPCPICRKTLGTQVKLQKLQNAPSKKENLENQGKFMMQ